MIKGSSGTNVSPVIGFFWRCVAVFILFGQVAAVAAPCRDYSACGSGSGSQHASSHVLDQSHGDRTEACANEFVPPHQVPAIDPAILVNDLGPAITVVALWPPTPSALVPQARRSAEPFAPVPRFLTFRRLLR